MLCRCIAAVADGQIWANSEELGFILAALAVSPSFQLARSSGLALLSKRELDVVRCLVEGQTNRQIAARLRISPHTVKNYMFKIFEKLGVSNRVELAFYVLSRLENSAQLQVSETDSSELKPQTKASLQGTEGSRKSLSSAATESGPTRVVRKIARAGFVQPARSTAI
jgi:DNA-binding CsgD family transcriptional regulator